MTANSQLKQHSNPFRTDIQAMRALAVLLVVAYHAHLPGAHAGFLGVDVFFVISGFVITNALLKERNATDGTSLLNFYGRRIRRILPAATVVIILTIFATYHWLSFIAGGGAADDAKWVASFAGNFHFAAVGTNYFTASNPPSTLQQFWSLAVEEQFYFVWPLVFLVACAVAKHRREVVLSSLLVVIGAVSLWWSIHQTTLSPTVAFFSPFTRAWELALGALLAVLAPRMRDWPVRLGSALRLVGFAAIMLSAWFLSTTTSWPGVHSVIPVVAAGLMVAGGSIAPTRRFDIVSRSMPVQWVGLISYSLYLVHWPILTLASEYSLTPLARHAEVELVLLSIVVAAVSYYLVERPTRSLRFLVQHRWATYLMGASLIGATYGAIFWHLHNYGA